MSLGPITPPQGGLGGAGAVAGGASGAPNPAAAAPSVTTQPQVAGAAPNIQAILAGLIGEALSAQDSLAPLLADLTAALQSPALPPAARATAQQILTLQAPLDGAVTGESLRTAVAQSGLFLEAGLASAVLKTAQPPADDLKALLLRLPADLAADSQVAAQQAAPAALGLTQPATRRTAPRPPPPVGGGLTSGQPPAPASLDADNDGAQVRQTLHHEALAALARLELLQAASAPKPGEAARWAFELPVAGQTGTGVAQFEISRDGRGSAGAAEEAEPAWKARFSLNLEGAGPVHAEVALSGGRTRVTLWAEREGARHDLDQGQAELTAALAGEDGGDAAVRVLSGAPAPPAAPAGQLINRTS